jgi:hypothetical protein
MVHRMNVCVEYIVQLALWIREVLYTSTDGSNCWLQTTRVWPPAGVCPSIE